MNGEVFVAKMTSVIVNSVANDYIESRKINENKQG